MCPKITYIMLCVAFVMDGALARDARSSICAISWEFEFKLEKSEYVIFAFSAEVRGINCNCQSYKHLSGHFRKRGRWYTCSNDI
jgi:hypothetical protein